MATYDVDFYGLSKYGPNQYTPPAGTTDESFTPFLVEYNVLPFVAVPVDYDRIRLTWQVPQASYDRAVLVRNRFGFPVSQTDGEVLFDSVYAPTSFEDTNVQGGKYYFYSLFVRANGTDWVRAGVTSTLMISFERFGQQMYDLLPTYIKYGNRDLTYAGEDNMPLLRFMWVFGWGLDHLMTQYDYFRRLHRVDDLSVPHLQELSDELGIDLEESVNLRLARQRVKNQALISREKGTKGGLRNLINAATGWDADVTVGNNLLLDNDQASFVHPVYPDWSPIINYPAGERVRFNHFSYEASLVNGAYGEAQAPSGTNTNNAYWKFLGDTDVQYPLWSDILSYPLGNYVEYEDKIYRAMLPSTNSVPTDNDVEILAPPDPLTLVTATTGGSLYGGRTYSYRVSAVNALGRETEASPRKYILTGANKANKVTISWPAVAGAIRYKVYGRTYGSEKLLTTTTTLTYVDTGTVVPAGAAPDTNNTETPYWRFVSDTLRNKETGGIYTWEGMYANYARLLDTQTAVRINGGLVPPGSTDPNAAYANSMFIANNTGVTADLALRSVARLTGPKLAGSTSTTGGSLAAATACAYRVSVVTADGSETVPGPTKTVTTGAGTTNTVTLVWADMPNAVAYKVYGRTAGSELYLATVTTNTYTDTGTVTPSGAYYSYEYPEPRQAIKDGIPLPIVVDDYSATKHYLKGDLARFQGHAFRAKRGNVGVSPPSGASYTTPTNEWEAVGVDDRLRYAMSAYLAPRSPSGGFTSWASPNVTPFIEWYDSRGKLIAALDAKSMGSNQLVNGNYETTPFAAQIGSFGGSTVTRDTVVFRDGTASAKTVTNSAVTAQGIIHKSTITFSTGTPLVASTHVKGPAGTVIQVKAQILDTSDVVLTNDAGVQEYTLTGGWDYVRTAQFTYASASFKTGLVVCLKTAASGVTFYADDSTLHTVNAPMFDTFSDGLDWSSRALEVGNRTWSENVGQWKSTGWKNGVAVPVDAATRSLATVLGSADGQVAATFRSAPTASGYLQGLVFRYGDTSNYFRATRTKLEVVVGGVLQASLGTYSKAIADNDRLTVKFVGNNITVYRNNKRSAPILTVVADTTAKGLGLVSNSRVGMVVES